MNQNTRGAEFSVMTQDELVGMVGGDSYLASRIGYGLGYFAGGVVNFVRIISRGPVDLDPGCFLTNY